MKTFKELFEDSYGEDSFNDDFLIDAVSANGVHESWKNKLTKEIEILFKNYNAPDIDAIISIIDGYKLTIYQARHDTLGYWYNLLDKAEYDGLEELGTYQLRILQT